MFQLVDVPTQFPGCTLLRETRGPVVDTGIDHNGWVYVTELEADEIVRHFPGVIEKRAALLGWVSPADHEEQLQEIARLGSELAERTGELERLKAQQPQLVDIDTARVLLLEKRTKPGPKPKAAA